MLLLEESYFFGLFVTAVLSLYHQERNAREWLKITRDVEGDFVYFSIEATFEQMH